MEISKIETLPLFLRLGSFKIDLKAELKVNCSKTSRIYSTKFYLKKRFHKPIIL